MNKKKRKWKILKFVQLPAEHDRLPSWSVYSMAVTYVGLFRRFKWFSAYFGISLLHQCIPFHNYSRLVL